MKQKIMFLSFSFLKYDAVFGSAPRDRIRHGVSMYIVNNTWASTENHEYIVATKASYPLVNYLIGSGHGFSWLSIA